jgi:hypothetical protein
LIGGTDLAAECCRLRGRPRIASVVECRIADDLPGVDRTRIGDDLAQVGVGHPHRTRDSRVDVGVVPRDGVPMTEAPLIARTRQDHHVARRDVGDERTAGALIGLDATGQGQYGSSRST